MRKHLYVVRATHTGLRRRPDPTRSRASTSAPASDRLVRFNTAGARKFAEVTQQNVGKPFAIVLDNQ